jgi:hypothetical protein
MHEISPVLAGTFDTADYTPAVSNFNPTEGTGPTTDVSSTQSIDPRRYTKFDRTASQVADAPDFSFHDFLDMINPLQHIPVVSSVYRAVTGDTINPVSRVAGDILYGGALGAISAVAGGVTSIGDAVAESQTGHDTTGVVLASLFGDDKASDTQMAQADPAASKDASTLAALTTQAATPTVQQALLQSIPQPGNSNSTVANAATSVASNAVTPAPLTTADSTAPLMQAKAFPLNRQAYGGVMAPVNDIESQNRIIALSEGSHAMRLGNTIYTNRLMNGPHPLPVAAPATSTASTDSSAATTAAAPAANAASSTPTTPATTTANTATTATTGSSVSSQHNALPQNLIDDMVMMKALNQYKGVAASSTPLGSSLDVSN